MLKILFLRKFSDQDTDYFKRHLSQYYEFIIPKDYSENNLANLVKDVDVVFGHRVHKELLDNGNNLKLIQLPGAGTDTLDFNLLKGRKIFVCNSLSHTAYVGEYAVSLAMSLIKKITLHDRSMRSGRWFSPTGDDSDDLYLSDSIIEKKIGLLGFGNVAQSIAVFLSSFKTKFLAYVRNPGAMQRISLGVPIVDFVELNEVLRQSDVIFIALPLTDETRDIISFEEFKEMRRTVYLVNVSRGPIINEEALFTALKDRLIAGAALDVWYDDADPKGDKKYPSRKYPFHELDNIVLSPYRAGYVKRESVHLRDVVKNLTLFAEEKRLINVIDINKGY